MKYTHKGWFMLCPIYFIEEGEAVLFDPRHQWLKWWCDANLWLFSIIVFLITLFNPKYVPNFAILVTGELE